MRVSEEVYLQHGINYMRVSEEVYFWEQNGKIGESEVRV